jgi:hypothetical protein
MPIYEDLKLRREGERGGEGVYIQEIWSCDATRDSSLSGDKLARHRPSAVTATIEDDWNRTRVCDTWRFDKNK